MPFFKKTPALVTPSLTVYMGYSVRAVVTPEMGMGLCVGVVSKSVSKLSLPRHISRDQLKHWKGKHCIYHWGHQWYEIQISGLDDRNASDYIYMIDKRIVSLLEDIMSRSEKPLPPELASLAHDTSVVLYKDNQGQDRGAPSSLCYQVHGSQDEEVKRIHGRTLLAPYQRRGAILEFVRNYLGRLRFGDTSLIVSNVPISVPQRMFTVPDFLFGNSKVLSVRGTSGAIHVSLDHLGSTRAALLRDKQAGFYQRDPLPLQYFIAPQSVAESYGERFVPDLQQTVDQLFPQDEQTYEPKVITYNDRGPKTYPVQGKAIIEAVTSQCRKPGHAVVMIHTTTDRRIGKEDQLEAMVVRELRELGIYSAVIHSDMASQCYEW